MCVLVKSHWHSQAKTNARIKDTNLLKSVKSKFQTFHEIWGNESALSFHGICFIDFNMQCTLNLKHQCILNLSSGSAYLLPTLVY